LSLCARALARHGVVELGAKEWRSQPPGRASSGQWWRGTKHVCEKRSRHRVRWSLRSACAPPGERGIAAEEGARRRTRRHDAAGAFRLGGGEQRRSSGRSGQAHVLEYKPRMSSIASGWAGVAEWSAGNPGSRPRSGSPGFRFAHPGYSDYSSPARKSGRVSRQRWGSRPSTMPRRSNAGFASIETAVVVRCFAGAGKPQCQTGPPTNQTPLLLFLH